MRIVDVCAFYSPRGGGVRTYIDQKLAKADKLGVEVCVVVPGEEDRVEERGPRSRLVTLASPRFPVDRRYGYFDDEAKIHAALDRLRPDFVEVSSPWRSPVMVSQWNPAVPRALIMHADPLAAYAYRWFGPFMARDAIDRRFDGYWRHLRKLGESFDAVICANRWLADRMKAGGLEKALLLPMGVADGLFAPARRDPGLRRALLAECQLGEDALLLVAPGRLAPEKRIPMLAEAVTLAGRYRPVGLVILGEGRERQAIIRAVRGNPHIRLLQPERDRQRFADVLASCDALLHGCEAETFCMAAAEARASGIPVIVPDEGGAAEFAAHGGGIVYRSASLAALSRALASFDPLNFDGSVAAPRTMGEHFAELFALYRRIAGNRRREFADPPIILPQRQMARLF